MLNHDEFYIFRTADGVIYGHTTDKKELWEYQEKARKNGFIYESEKNGSAWIYTIYTSEEEYRQRARR